MHEIVELDIRDVDVARRVWELQQAAYRVEARLIGFDGIPNLLETIDALRVNTLSWRGVFVDNLVVGAAAVAIADDTVDIDRLVVDPNYFRRGIGRSLIASVIGLAARSIVSTGTKNHPAVALYRSSGFETVGTQPIAPGVTISLFERRSND